MKQYATLLYVDDEPINLTVFELNFKKKYKVITASSGKEGLLRLEENRDIMIVISDMKMPGMDGIEFIRKAKENFDSITCFILTGFDITDDISKALEENIIRKYFRKPFNVKEIDSTIAKILE